ncbi:MAG: LL-diaminopimelate aminotransferase [Muribaculaceae bacterium]|nr:LL-diaminopimelate aminotransferase [Muribaculaceae bacterium]
MYFLPVLLSLLLTGYFTLRRQPGKEWNNRLKLEKAIQVYINENFIKLPQSYLFSTVASKLKEYREAHPDADLIRMDIGDVTLPVASCVIEAMHRAVDDMASSDTFHGYGPEQGYPFLREAIAKGDYQERGIDIKADDIFISDGAKSDLGNLGNIYSQKSVIGVADPGYPVYVDSSVMDGRGGDLLSDGRWSRILYMDCKPENGFKPEVPARGVDVVFLCSPCNPTGTVFTRDELKEWVEYAQRNKTLIVFDSAYEAFVRDPEIPRSIYEIEGAKEVAIEIRSFSKTAGFTGLRCGYTVVPSELKGMDREGNEFPLRQLWNRRQSTKFNGASYIIQRGAEALYTSQGRDAIKGNIDIYLSNALYIRKAMEEAGFEVYGGDNSPYVWAKLPGEDDSWKLFERILSEAEVSSTPGIGFGESGAGYIRLTGFNSPKNTRKAMERISRINFKKDDALEDEFKSLNDIKAIKALDDLNVLDDITEALGL